MSDYPFEVGALVFISRLSPGFGIIRECDPDWKQSYVFIIAHQRIDGVNETRLESALWTFVGPVRHNV